MDAEIVSAITGGLISAVPLLICNILDHRHNHKMEQERNKKEDLRWARDKKESVYVELADILDKVNIPVDSDTGRVECTEIRNRIKIIADWMDKNRGKLILYMPDNIYSDIMHLRGDLYKMLEDESLKEIDFSDLKKSYIYQCVIEAKKINSLLKQDFLG